jgi:hypothetical protein
MIEAQYQLAANPETAPEILRELSLSDDLAIRQAVAGNPNVPIEVLWELVRDFSDEVVNNPLFSLVILENPNWISHIPQNYLSELLRNPRTHPFFLQKAAEKSRLLGEDGVRALIANPSLSGDLVELAILNANWLCGEVLKHSSLTLSILEKCSVEGHWRIQYDLAHYLFSSEQPFSQEFLHSSSMDETLDHLVKHGSDYFKSRLLRAVKLPSKYIPELIQALPHKFLVMIARSRCFSPAVLDQLFQHPIAKQGHQIQIHQLIASNINTPLHILEKLAESPHATIRDNLASHKRLPKPLIIQLAIDPHHNVQKNLLANPSIAAELLAELKIHPDPRIREFAQQHPNTPK